MKLIITEPTNNKNNAYEILRAYFLYNDVYVPKGINFKVSWNDYYKFYDIIIQDLLDQGDKSVDLDKIIAFMESEGWVYSIQDKYMSIDPINSVVRGLRIWLYADQYHGKRRCGTYETVPKM
jgi:hypothetical protein